MAKYFNGLSLISAAGIVSETFVKLGLVWRIVLIVVLFSTFSLGLLFANVSDEDRAEEEQK